MKTTWFTISGLNVSIAHKGATKEIWSSYPNSQKSAFARQAIKNFAIKSGFRARGNNENCVKDALIHLIREYPGATKSWIIRKALIDGYSMLDTSTT